MSTLSLKDPIKEPNQHMIMHPPAVNLMLSGTFSGTFSGVSDSNLLHVKRLCPFDPCRVEGAVRKYWSDLRATWNSNSTGSPWAG